MTPLKQSVTSLRTVTKSTTLGLLDRITPEAETLEHSYLNSIRQVLLSEIGETFLKELDRVVSRFTLWRGGCTPIGELSEQLVIDFETWLRSECGLGERCVIKHTKGIRRIMRAINPLCVRERWEGRKGGRGNQPRIDEPADDGTIRHFFETVYRPRRLLGKSPNTFRLYSITFRNFRRYLGREGQLTDLTDDSLAGFVQWKLDRGRTVDTAIKDCGQLLAIARYAFRKRYLEIEPELSLPRPPRREPTAWMMGELAKLFAAVDKLQGRIVDRRASDWWRALLLMIYYTAERIGAIMQLRWRDVDLERGWVMIPAEYRKGKPADKATELHSVVVEALRAIEGPADALVFPWPRTMATLYHRLKRIHVAAGLPVDRRSKFHRMRRTSASWFKAKGGDPSQLLGHADPKVTAKYLDPRICGTKSAAALLDDPTALAIGGAQ